MISEEKSIAYKLREFFSDLLTSKFVRLLQNELIRCRLEYQAEIRELRAEKALLWKKLEKLELALNPQLERTTPEYQARREAFQRQQSTTDFSLPSSHWAEALQAHNQILKKEEEEAECQSSSSPQSSTGAVVVPHSTSSWSRSA